MIVINVLMMFLNVYFMFFLNFVCECVSVIFNVFRVAFRVVVFVFFVFRIVF